MHRSSWTVGSIHTGSTDDVLFGDPSYLRYPARRIFLNTLPELRKANTPLIHKFLIIESLIDNDIQHAQGEGIVSTRSDLEENVCLGGDFREAGVNHN